jgi:subtilisin-like proprotein convertase family protein
LRPSASRNVVLWLALAGAALLPASAAPLQVGRAYPFEAGSPHPYSGGRGKTPVWSLAVEHPGATYLAVHFDRFELGRGDHVVVRAPDGGPRHVFTGRGKGDLGEFWATHVPGDRLIVELFSPSPQGGGWGVSIDRYAAGDPDLQAAAGTEAICSMDDKEAAVCYESEEPAIYQSSRAVARLLVHGMFLCTGWLVGCEGHLITNNHCIDDPALPTGPEIAVVNTDYEFLAEAPLCGTSCPSCRGTVWSGAAELVRHDADLDYALIRLAGDPQVEYGSLLLDDRAAVPGERIYIPQHPGGRPKEIGVYSTDSTDESGYCEVLGTDEPPCTGGPGDVGYQCDTEGGSSGSPVIAYADHRVIALHHCANCPNRAVPIGAVIDDLGTLLPSCALEAGPYLVLDALTMDDTAGNGDGIADPGEWLGLRVDLRNVGTASATRIDGALSGPAPLVRMPRASGTWPDLDPTVAAASDAGSFQIVLDPSLSCGDVLDLQLAVSTDQGSFHVDVPLTVGEDLAPQLSAHSSDTPLPIPDGSPAGVVSQLPVSESLVVGDVSVALDIAHTWISDLTVDLRSPAGTVVRLHDRTGGSGDNILRTYDAAAPPDGPGSLSDFVGEDSLGAWELEVVDHESIDAGMLQGWTLYARSPADFACDPAPAEVSPAGSTVPLTILADDTFRFALLPEEGITYTAYGAKNGDGIQAGEWSYRICDLATTTGWQEDPPGVARWTPPTPLPPALWVVVAERHAPGPEGPYGYGTDGLPRTPDADRAGSDASPGCP